MKQPPHSHPAPRKPWPKRILASIKQSAVFRQLWIAIPVALATILLTGTVETVRAKYRAWLNAPQLEVSVAGLVAVEGTQSTSAGVRQSLALYDLRDQCLVGEMEADSSPSSFQPQNPPGELDLIADLNNRGRDHVTHTKLGFLSSFGREVTIEATPNLTIVTQVSKSQFTGDETIVTIADLPAGAEGFVIARVAIPSSSFSLRTAAAASGRENVALTTSPTWFSGQVHFLGSDQMQQPSVMRQISIEESLRRYTNLIGRSKLNLPAFSRMDRAIQMKAHEIVNPGCAYAHAGLNLSYE